MRLVSCPKEIRRMLEKRKMRIEENPDMYGIGIKEMLEGKEPIKNKDRNRGMKNKCQIRN